MPYYRSRFRRRRKFKRRGYWKRKQKRYTGKGQRGIRFFKLRRVQTISSDAGGVINVFANNGPQTGFQDWSNIVSLFDSYRVPALKVKYIPQLPNDASTLTGYHPVYVIGDVDANTPPIISVNEAIQYENCKVKNMYMPWKYYFKCPKLGGVGNIASVKTQAGGWIDVATPYGNAGIQMIGNGFDLSTDYGTLVWTIYLMAKDRR